MEKKLIVVVVVFISLFQSFALKVQAASPVFTAFANALSPNIEATIEAVERKNLGKGYNNEYSDIFDSVTGHLAYQFVGGHYMVPFPLNACWTVGNAENPPVLTHNHNRDGFYTFSAEDIEVFERCGALQMRVASWYDAKNVPMLCIIQRDPASGNSFSFVDTKDMNADFYAHEGRKGDTEPHWDQFWTRFAADHGYGYQCVQFS